MKKFWFISIAITLVLAVMIYFVSIVFATNERYLEVREELAISAAEVLDAESFVKFHSIAYVMLFEEESTDYMIQIFHLIGEGDNETYDQLAVFVIAKTDVNHAITQADLNDQTKMVITNNSENTLFYDSMLDANYKNYAMSSTLENIGLYYYAISIDQDIEMTIELFDYDENEILSEIILFEIADYSSENPNGYFPSYTQEEKEEVLNLSDYTIPMIIQNLTIFAISDIVILYGLSILIKRKKKTI
jgi:hypothetical protein